MLEHATHSSISWRILAKAALAALVAVALVACGSSDSTDTTTGDVGTTAAPQNLVHVSLTEDGSVQGVESDVTVFKAGTPYHFIVENTADRSHELMIVEPIEAGMMDMEEMDDMALYVAEEDELPPNSTYEFDFTFPADSVGTDLEFACHIEGHYEAGMHLGITVEA